MVCQNNKSEKLGISLISLVITIVILIILAGISIYSSTKLIDEAGHSKTRVEFEKYKEDLRIYKDQKLAESVNFDEETLFADKESLTYNTMKTGESGTIRTIIKDVKDNYVSIITISSGDLYINTNDTSILEIAKECGFKEKES